MCVSEDKNTFSFLEEKGLVFLLPIVWARYDQDFPACLSGFTARGEKTVGAVI